MTANRTSLEWGLLSYSFYCKTQFLHVFISGKPCWYSDIRCRRSLFCHKAVRPHYHCQGDIQGRFVYFTFLTLRHFSTNVWVSRHVCVCPHVSTLQEAVFSLWLWWKTAAWTYDPCRATRVVTVGLDGRLDGVFHSASCCPETTWTGQRSSHLVKVMNTMLAATNENSTV